MKVALNIESVGARRGGAEKYAGTVARWLTEAGHEVHVVARRVDAEELPPGVRVHRVEAACPPGLGGFRAYQFARESEGVLRRGDFDLIVGFVKTWYQHAYLAVGGAQPASLECNSRRFRSPLTRSAWYLSKAVNPKQHLFREIARRQFETEHRPHVIAPSRRVAEDFRRFHHVEPERLHVVYNALDPASIPPDVERARGVFRDRHGLRPEQAAVLFVARNYALKGLEPLLHAFSRVAPDAPDAVLAVCGSEKDAPYRRLARRLGLEKRVLFLGFVPDIRECFAGSDVFAFPTFYDPCSLVVPEAMAAGLPVLTTRQNGAGELIEPGEDGFVVESPWAVDEMADRLRFLLGNAERRREMGEHARQSAGRLTVAARSQELLEALEAAARDPLASPRVRDRK